MTTNSRLIEFRDTHFPTAVGRMAFDQWQARRRTEIESYQFETAPQAERGNPLQPRVENGVLNLSVYLPIGYDFFGMVFIGPQDFVDAFAEADDDAMPVAMNVDSPGGSVFAARAICAELDRRTANGGTVKFHAAGLAASAATFLLCAATERTAGTGSRIMVHNASGMVYGGSGDMEKMAKVLRDIDAEIAQGYADVSGKLTARQFAKHMDDETYFAPQDAKKAGLVQRVTGKAKKDDDATNAAQPVAEAAPKATESPTGDVQAEGDQDDKDSVNEAHSAARGREALVSAALLELAG